MTLLLCPQIVSSSHPRPCPGGGAGSLLFAAVAVAGRSGRRPRFIRVSADLESSPGIGMERGEVAMIELLPGPILERERQGICAMLR